MMEWEMTSISDAKVRLHELVAEAANRPILLLRRSKPEAVIISFERFRELSREIEDLKDRLAVYRGKETPPDLRMPLEKLLVDLDMLGEGGPGA